MREVISRMLLGLFSANEVGFNAVAAMLMIIEACLSHIVILKVKYTEIDWSTYMQQVECYVNKGILNYTEIGGDTGPVVYPAGHIFVYRILYFLTSSGRNIRLAQHLFQGFYLFNVFMVFRILQKTMRIPPIVLFLVTITGYRIHSIFMLRLFNDPLAMMLFYVAMDRFLEQKWLVGCIFYSLAVSIKMNVLLFAPALFFTLLLNNNYMSTLGYLAVCGLIQLYVGGPFLLHDWKSYVHRSFDLGRVFMFKWTVNWRFLPEELFLDKRFHIALLVGHLTFLAVFAYYMWFRRLNGLRSSLYIRFFEGITTTTGSLETYYAFCTSNLIGIAFSRSLHYQFYSWYFHQLPFLLFCDYPHVSSLSMIPWKQFFWKVPLLLAIELSWNVYPSTWWSSALLHVCHIIIFWHLISTRPDRPVDSVSKDTLDRLLGRQEKIQEIIDEHGDVVPRSKWPDYEEDDVKKPKLNISQLKNRFLRKLEEEEEAMDELFDDYFDDQMETLKEDPLDFYTDDGEELEMQVSSMLPVGKRKKLKIAERIEAVFNNAVMIETAIDSEDEQVTSPDESERENIIEEENSETDESDECTDADVSEEESIESEESEEEDNAVVKFFETENDMESINSESIEDTEETEDEDTEIITFPMKPWISNGEVQKICSQTNGIRHRMTTIVREDLFI